MAGAVLALGAVGLMGCPLRSEQVADTRTESASFASGKLLSLRGGNGKVRIRGGSGTEMSMTAEIKVEARDYASRSRLERIAEDLLAQVEIKVEPQSTGVSIETIAPATLSPIGAGITVDYDIELPHEAKIRVESGNGDVDIEGTQGSAEIELGNGDLKLSSIEGSIDARIGNGTTECVETTGILDLEVGNGEASITHSALLTPDEIWSIDVGKGRATARLNKDSAFSVQARASVGRIDEGCFGFFVAEQFPWVGQEANEQVGSGGGRLDIRVGSGNIEFNCL